jgi:hypothetical protein
MSIQKYIYIIYILHKYVFFQLQSLTSASKDLQSRFGKKEVKSSKSKDEFSEEEDDEEGEEEEDKKETEAQVQERVRRLERDISFLTYEWR